MPLYTSYILRVWQVKEGHNWTWRATLERISDGERFGFVSLEELFVFLQEHSTEVTGPQQDDSEPWP